jgi:hemolysin activation/secretion protein
MRFGGAVMRALPVGLVALSLCGQALAQGADRGVKLTEDEDLVEELAPAASIDRTPVLPPMRVNPNVKRLAGLPTLLLNGIRIDGSTALSAAEIESVASPYVGQKVSTEGLEHLRQRLSLLYFDKGYVNSGVVLPDQDITDNTVRFREVRGEMTDIRLSGNAHLRDRYILNRIEEPEGGLLEINALQTNLQLLEQDPMIARINAQLLPGGKPGEGVLRMEVAEVRPWQFVTRADNHRSPGVGGEQLSLLIKHRSLTGIGDEATILGSFSDGYADGYGSYSRPLTRFGTRAEIYGSTSDSDIVEAPFDQIDIASNTGTYGLKFTQRLRRSLTTKVSAFLGSEVKHNENFLLGEPFSFTYGERDGKTDVTVIYTGLEFAKRWSRAVMAARGTVRRGIYRAGATKNRKAFGVPNIGPDGLFTSFQLEGQLVRNLERAGSAIIGRVSAQVAWHPLLAMEKLPIGGANSVRGYRENLLVRDNGIVASIEYQRRLFDTDSSVKGFDPRRLRLALFADYGESWNDAWEFDPNSDKEELASVGAGLLWNPSASVSATLYWGHAIRDVGTGDDTLQDSGIHLSFSWTPWPE